MADIPSTPPASESSELPEKSSPPEKSTPPEKSLPSRGLRLALLAGILLVGLYAFLVFAIDTKLRHSRQTFEGDHSLDIRAYLPPPELPENAINATDFLEAAALVSDGQKQAYYPRSGSPPEDLMAIKERLRRAEIERTRPTPEDLEHFGAAVERHDLSLKILDQGLDSATGARYKTDYQVRPFEVIIPNLLVRLRFSALLRARAELAVVDQRHREAWQDAVRIFQLAHWTTDDTPTLINTLVARAIANQGSLLTQSLLASAPVPPEIRAPVEEWARKMDTVRAINRMLDAERAVMFDLLLDPRTPVDDLKNLGNAGPIQRLLFGWHPWRRLNAALYLESATRRFEICAAPTYRISEEQLGSVRKRPPEWVLPARAHFFDCLEVARKRDIWLVLQHQVGLAMELEQIREATGRYPPQLTESPLDPFSGEAYKYRRDGEGYVLYSVSANGRDDGGMLAPANDQGFADYSQGDLVWRVALPDASEPSRGPVAPAAMGNPARRGP
ncbi:MAG: hypothetical protein MI919_06500 [Holophagales bacterium]|nr:hypothetical protein [Holophagales bacterium]